MKSSMRILGALAVLAGCNTAASPPTKAEVLPTAAQTTVGAAPAEHLRIDEDHGYAYECSKT